MTREERISFLKHTCAGIESQIEKLKTRIKGGDHREIGSLHGAVNDAQLSLHKHQHELKELTTGGPSRN